MSQKYIEPKPGTIRGPFVCGKDTNYKKVNGKSVWTGFETVGGFRSAEAGIQYAVKLANGCWAYFIEFRTNAAKALKDAQSCAKLEIIK